MMVTIYDRKTDSNPDEIVKLSVVSDTFFPNNKVSLLKSDLNYLFKKMPGNVQSSDIVIGNIEGVLSSTTGNANTSKIRLRMPFSFIEALKSININVASLANNHVCDYGEESLFDMIDTFKKSGIQTVGAGRNIDEASRSIVIKKKGIILAFLSFCCRTTNGQNYASTNLPGVAPLDLELVEDQIEKTKIKSDIVVVSFHWGREQWHYPSPEQIRIAHRSIELGADIVIGHHVHVVQGYEIYKNKIILYGMGNFLFDDIEGTKRGRPFKFRLRKENRESFIFQALIAKDGIVSGKIVPTYINQDCQVIAQNKLQKKRFMHNMMRYSKRIKDVAYLSFWKHHRISKICGFNPPDGPHHLQIRNILNNLISFRIKKIKATGKGILLYMKIKIYGLQPDEYSMTPYE